MSISEPMPDISCVMSVEAGTIVIPAETAALFDDTFIGGAIRAVADGMVVKLPLEVATIVQLNAAKDVATTAAKYSISTELLQFLALKFAYDCGVLQLETYIKELFRNFSEITNIWSGQPCIEKAVFDILNRPDGNSNAYYDIIPDSFLELHVDKIFGGITPLMMACTSPRRKLALYLIQTGKANCDYVACHGSTALMYALELICHFGPKYNVVSYAIIETGKSNLEHADRDGNTVLIWACMYKLSDIALTIIELGGNPAHKNKKGYTALDYANRGKLVSVVAALAATATAASTK
jgi:hypothetical protein